MNFPIVVSQKRYFSMQLGTAFSYVCKKIFLNLFPWIIESARIDGSLKFTTFYKIVFPLIVPAIATVIVFSFIGT